MEFPHLQDTPFPYLNRENVYAFKNEFDYTRWNEHTRVHLLNVRWDSSYNDVPLFASVQERDSWFSAKAEYSTEITQAVRIVPDGYIKLPVPYDVATCFNYLYIQMPLATDETHPIDYENRDGITEWFFFIDALEYGAPNCTHTFLTLDAWTTFCGRTSIEYMMLERGHAPVAATDTDTYLANPIENNVHLLTRDVDFGGGSIVRHSDFIPFGNGKKYVVFASMATRADMLIMGNRTGTGEGAWTPAGFYDSSARDGHDMNITGYVWGNGYDYSELRTRISNGASNLDRIANNVTCWGIPASDCFGFRGENYDQSFLVKLGRECPSFLQTIKAMFVVDESMLSFNYDPVTICGYELRYCRGTEEEPIRYELDKSMFSIPEKYQRFAKLYTYPYSYLELTDNDGTTIEVHIEDTGELSFQRVTALAFPYLDMRVLFHGVSGSGNAQYRWTSLTGDESTIDIGSDDWGRIRFDWPIPTYALYMDGETAYHLRKDGELKNARIDAVTAYHASMREANCAKNNAIALANAAESNANDNADTLVANTANSCNAQTANTALTVATNTANVTLGNNASVFITTAMNELAEAKMRKANTLMTTATAAENEVSIATSENTARYSVMSGALNGMVGNVNEAAMASTAFSGFGGAAAAGALVGVGGVLGAASGYLNAQADVENSLILTQVKTELANATGYTNAGNVELTNDTNDLVTETQNDLKSDQNTNNNNCITSQTANNVGAARANSANNAATMRGTASRSAGTARSNAGYSQTAAERTAKEILEAAQRKARNRMECAQNEMPQPYGEVSGNPAPDYHRTRGVQVKARSQSDSAIARAGDTFARYGYAYDGVWNVEESGLCPMQKFCYWKAREVWVYCGSATGNHFDKVITDIFRNGVTVWKNPDEIGRVSVYDN